MFPQRAITSSASGALHVTRSSKKHKVVRLYLSEAHPDTVTSR